MHSHCPIALLFIFSHAGQGECSVDSRRLFEDLLSNYNRLSRPARLPSDNIEIQFKLKLLQLLDVHEKDQVITIKGWLLLHWSDYRLQWRPSKYGNVSMLHLPGELLWLPDIILYNNAHGSPAVSAITKVDVYSNGRLRWQPPVTFYAMCKMNIEWFPYDEQHCDMKFGSWTFGGSELDLLHLESDVVEKRIVENETEWRVEMGIDVSEYQESVEWELMSIAGTRHEKWYPCCDYPSIDITYYLSIRRKKLFYTVNLLFPCVGIAALTSFTFYLPSESHNKVTLSVSVLVSLTFFSLVLIDIIPPTSLHTPLIGKYLMFTMAMVTLSIIVTVFLQNIHYRSEYEPMPSWIRHFFIGFLGKHLLMYRKLNDPSLNCRTKFKKRPSLLKALSVLEDGTDDEDEEGERSHEMVDLCLCKGRCALISSRKGELLEHCKSSYELVARAGDNIHYMAEKLAEESRNEQMRADWRYVAMVMDRVLLIGFSITITLGSVAALLSAINIRDTRKPIAQS